MAVENNNQGIGPGSAPISVGDLTAAGTSSLQVGQQGSAVHGSAVPCNGPTVEPLNREPANPSPVELPDTVFAARMAGYFRAGLIKRGDIVLVKSGERAFINGAIEFAQGQALRDLRRTGAPKDARHASIDKSEVQRCKTYTHAAMVLSEYVIGELYYPEARTRAWNAFELDTEILIRRPTDLSWNECAQAKAAAACRADVAAKTPYATKELFYYWFRFCGLKIWLRRKFANVFRDKKYNVCSGQVVLWLKAGGAMEHESPEAWYPARLAADYDRFYDVMQVKV